MGAIFQSLGRTVIAGVVLLVIMLAVAGTFGSDIMVRLPDEERAKLISEEGAALFEPMAGRPMKEYVVLPRAWHNDPEKVRKLLRRSLEWAAQLPAKAPAGRRKRR